MWNVKEGVAHRALAARPREGRLALPASRDAWAKNEAETLGSALKGSGYDIIGDLAELRPADAGSHHASPADAPAEQVLDAAVAAASALVVNQYHKEYPAANTERKPSGPRGLVGRVESTVGASPRLKRTVRELSSRSSAVRSMRVMVWRALERRRAERRS
jgi:hypothetical protein